MKNETLETFSANIRKAIRDKNSVEIAGGIFVPNELKELEAVLTNPASHFANYCQARALASADTKAREWWQRMAGNARKALTM